MEGSDPFSAVLSPEKHPVTRADAAPDEQCGKATGQPRNLTVCGDPPAVALVAHHGDLAIIAAKIVEECSQMVSHGLSAQVQPGSPSSMHNQEIRS